MRHHAVVLIFSLGIACGSDIDTGDLPDGSDPLDPAGSLDSVEAREIALRGTSRRTMLQKLREGRWREALTTCSFALRSRPEDCDARYCELIARAMLFVDEYNQFLLPLFRAPRPLLEEDYRRYGRIIEELGRGSTAADAVTARGCEFDGPTMPLVVGELAEPILVGEVRGRWTPRAAHAIGALMNAHRYLIETGGGPLPVTPPPPGETVPGLPELLGKVRVDLLAHDQLLFSAPSRPRQLRGGWHDRDHDGVPSPADELLIDIFEPGSDRRIFDFSRAEFVSGQQMRKEPLVPTGRLPAARCGYQRWHIDTLFDGSGVGTTDGMTFSPDGTRIAVPLQVDGHYQIHTAGLDGSDPVCLTCGGAPLANDGVRWHPSDADTMLFVSNRDHPLAVGGSSGGWGQELYAMRADGSRQTRLTVSPHFATNYHPNWSHDGRRIVWGTTRDRTYDIMIADFVNDRRGMRLANVRRLTHDTTWWESHGFSADGRWVIVTNTRAGLMASDLYAIDIHSGRRKRLTDGAAWEEHAHVSPDGRKLAFMSGRFREAAVQRLNDGSLSPLFDFAWISPGVFFEFINHPAGYGSELAIMDADGTHVQRLTTEDKIVADSVWSPDSKQILFRQQDPWLGSGAQIRLLTFDDCR